MNDAFGKYSVGLDLSEPTRGLIGRRAETQWLRSRLTDAKAGTPHVVLLHGEVGIGKSRLARELVEEACATGFTASIARFREQPGPPFDAFAADFFPRLADIYAENSLVTSSPAIPGGADGHTKNDTVSKDPQTMAAVRDAFSWLIRRRPFVLFVDDIQWADVASRQWLVNLAALAADTYLHAPTHLLMLIAVRDAPGGHDAPELELLRRETITTSLTLHGLTELDVSKLANALGAGDLPLEVLKEVARVTQGNPLFAAALLRQCAVDRAAGSFGDTLGRVRLPSEVHDLVIGRVTSLSAACQQMLTMAALLGGRWQFEELVAITTYDDETLAELLDEAERAEVIIATDGYDFTHPLFERAVLATVTKRRRRQVQARIADVLIERSAHAPIAEMSIAQHLIEAGDLADPARLLEYCPKAGDSAMAGFAWGAAARFYEAALQALEEMPDAAPRSKAELALLASSARLENDEPTRAVRLADAALAALGENPPPEVTAEAWSARLRAELRATTPGQPVDLGPLERLAPMFETEEPRIAASVYSVLGSAYAYAAQNVEPARRACRKAIDLGTRAGGHAACAHAWGQLAITEWMTLEISKAVESLEAEATHAAEAGDRASLGHSRGLLPMTLFWLGRFDDAEAAIDTARSTTREVSYSRYDGFVLLAKALLCAARGMFDESDAAIDDGIEIGRVIGYQVATPLLLPVAAATRSLRGDEEGMNTILAQWAPSGAPPDRAAFAWLLRQRLAIATAHRPHTDELEGIWQMFASPQRISSDTAAALVIEIGAGMGRTDLCDGPSGFLTDLSQRGQVLTTMGIFIPRVLGIAARASGEVARARTLLEENLAVATRFRAHAEVAETQYALAELFAEHFEETDVVPMLEAAHRMAGPLGLAPLASRCRALGERLGLSLPTAPLSVQKDGDLALEGTGTAVILFTDIVDSVALTETWGDWVFYDRSQALHESLRNAIASCSGSLIEGITLGDGLIAEFRSAERGLNCALQCGAIAERAGLPLHIGLHAGDVIRSGGDIFGGALNIAARICSEAAPGQVLVSQTIRDLSRTSSPLKFESVGFKVLKGVADPILLYSVYASI
jgi:class 3 adenylate cyclase/tetratricopeptide (TPR) repeat protein